MSAVQAAVTAVEVREGTAWYSVRWSRRALPQAEGGAKGAERGEKVQTLVERRFRQFDQLRRELCDVAGHAAVAEIPFPAKVWFGNADFAVAQARRMGLGRWLSAVLALPGCPVCPAMEHFLSSDHNNEADAAAESAADVAAAESAADIAEAPLGGANRAAVLLARQRRASVDSHAGGAAAPAAGWSLAGAAGWLMGAE